MVTNKETDMKKGKIWACLIGAGLMVAGLSGNSYAKARIVMPAPGMVHADEKTVHEIEALYDGLEDALADKDIDRIMTFYADDYSHNSATKAQLKFLWDNEFGKFDKLYSVHAFTDINVVDNEAAIVCTGTLFGLPKGGKEFVVVDTWAEQPHYLTKKSGSWKIVGGATHWKREPVKGGFRLEFHPFF